MEEQKYKIIFISEDKIEYYGVPGANTMHSIYLTEYIQKYFKEHPILGQLTERHGADSLAYALTYFEHMAIVLNETRIGPDGKPKYGTFACLELPPVVSDKLKSQILSLSDSLSCFSQLVVEQALVEDNFITGALVDIDDNLPMEEKLNQAIDSVNNRNHTR